MPSFFGDELPGEGDRVFLEVVAEGEVAEHLEEGVVARGDARRSPGRCACRRRARTSARRWRACRVALSRPVKTSLNCTIPALVNSSVGSLRHQRRRGDLGVALATEIVEKSAANRGGVHGEAFNAPPNASQTTAV